MKHLNTALADLEQFSALVMRVHTGQSLDLPADTGQSNALPTATATELSDDDVVIDHVPHILNLSAGTRPALYIYRFYLIFYILIS